VLSPNLGFFSPQPQCLALHISTNVARRMVRLSVCWAHVCPPRKWLNRSRCRLGSWLRWAQGNMC